MKKLLIISGHAALLITLFLSLYFFKERVLYVDPGQQLFQMINQEDYIVFVHRHSMVINETLPLLAIKLGLPLKAVVMIYSCSFVLIYYLCFVLAVYGFRNIAAGIGIAFVPLLLREAFAHSISEAWLGIAYSTLFYALLNYYREWQKKGNLFLFLFYTLATVLIVINYFIHPITLFTLGFALGFTYFHKKEYKSSHIYALSGLVLLLFSYKFFFPSHEHDESFFEGIRHADQHIPKLFRLPVISFFTEAFSRIYWIPAIALLLCSIFYIRHKLWGTLLFTAGFICFYLLIAALAFYKRDGHMVMESRLMPLAMMVFIPFAEIVRKQSVNFTLTTGLCFVFAFSFYGLVQLTKKVHTRRIDAYREALKETAAFPERKFYIFREKISDPAVNSWGSSVETLLLSAMDGPQHSRTIHYFWKGESVSPDVLSPNCTFIWVPWWLYLEEQNLNPDYFRLECTAYRELPEHP